MHGDQLGDKMTADHGSHFKRQNYQAVANRNLKRFFFEIADLL